MEISAFNHAKTIGLFIYLSIENRNFWNAPAYKTKSTKRECESVHRCNFAENGPLIYVWSYSFQANTYALIFILFQFSEWPVHDPDGVPENGEFFFLNIVFDCVYQRFIFHCAVNNRFLFVLSFGTMLEFCEIKASSLFVDHFCFRSFCLLLLGSFVW